MIYKLKMGEPYRFEADTDDEFLAALRKKHSYAKESDVDFMRQVALSACEWSGGSVNFSSVRTLRDSLIHHGILEVADA